MGFLNTEMKFDHNKPGVILLEKKTTCSKVDVACPFNPWIEKKEKDKVQKNEVTKVCNVPAVIGALGMVLKNVSRYLEITGFNGLEKL